MPVCASCGQGNPARARFCMSCASPLSLEQPAAHTTRKTVTVVFCDLVGSTPLAERLDPESVRAVMNRFFRQMRAALERHGGTVEKYIGDAVMAVFGVPLLHEDDAFRAVRAAQAMREELDALNVDLQGRFGVQVRTRIGVNTGEIVVGDAAAGQALVVGTTVNVAARLQPAAASGERRPGPATGARAHGRAADEPGARPGSLLVGRDGELEVLGSRFYLAVAERSCVLVTILGPAGIGKSRLAREFVSTMKPDALVLRARCLPYGDGITFGPVADLVKQACGVVDDDGRSDARSKIDAAMAGWPDATLLSDRVSDVTGVADATGGLQETFWAIRRFLEWV